MTEEVDIWIWEYWGEVVSGNKIEENATQIGGFNFC